jgi:thiamine-monophosphate kinase
LAAMGADPAWVTLSLTLPEAHPDWLEGFCAGFFTLANTYAVQLIGGDLTRGPLSITVQALGLVKKNQALLRSQAKADDLIYVSGTVGDAGLALQAMQGKISLPSAVKEAVFAKLNRPEPRLALGEKLRGLAHAAIDISDGLAADLGHILEASGVGAIIQVDQLPLSLALKQTLSMQQAITLALTAGDDYELCFTLPAANTATLEQALISLPYTCTCIGKITQQQGLIVQDKQGNTYKEPVNGYQHF